MSAERKIEAAGETRLPSRLTPVFRVLDWVTSFAYRVSALILLAITALYCMEIALRYFFLSPTLWTRDTITYFLCATLLLAAPQVARDNTHVAINIFVEMMPQRIKGRMETILALLTGLISGGVAWITAQDTIRLFDSNILTLTTIAVPKWWISIFIPIGFALVALQFLSLALDPTRMGHDKRQV
ncbi:TRAP transporter small permease [Rhodospirillaceae bacterium KN72]|uniref:TRAP transporter small permease protein n=1 Tax=Pacificispira spongiicola TaxID=2729598 RepID=A0A7Y0HEW3_9PROT|nr:TRAP transporter small permease [Pacificispira spongiicola]NMM45291.1 TRAP transporter small permease [Pacificispira spongiicola]